MGVRRVRRAGLVLVWTLNGMGGGWLSVGQLTTDRVALYS